MEAVLRAKFVGPRVLQDELSPEAQRIISQASADDYNEIYPFSDAFEELLRALDKRAYIDGNIRKDAGVRANEKEMIQYEQTYYDHFLRIADGQNE